MASAAQQSVWFNQTFVRVTNRNRAAVASLLANHCRARSLYFIVNTTGCAIAVTCVPSQSQVGSRCPIPGSTCWHKNCFNLLKLKHSHPRKREADTDMPGGFNEGRNDLGNEQWWAAVRRVRRAHDDFWRKLK